MVKQQKKNMRRRSSDVDAGPELQLDAKHLEVSERDMSVVKKHRMSTLVAAKTAERTNVVLNSIDKCDDVWEQLEKLEVSSAAAVILVTPFIVGESLVKITNRAILGPLARLFNLDDRCDDDSDDEEEEEEDCHSDDDSDDDSEDSEDDHSEDEEEEDCHHDSEDDHSEDEDDHSEDEEDDHSEDEEDDHPHHSHHSHHGCKNKKKKNFLARMWDRLYKKDKKKCKRKCRK